MNDGFGMNACSKTDLPCDCGWLALAINDPSSGVVFDRENNRICLTHGQSEYPLYHCPGCGGAFPDSSEPVWVPIVPPEEFKRVEQLVAGLQEVNAIISRLGPPDYDVVTHSFIARDGRYVRDESRPVRNIEYYRHSDWLAIEFYIRPGKPAVHHIVIKKLSPRHGAKVERGGAANK